MTTATLSSAPNSDTALRPLLRLHQLAQEIERAVQGGDIELMQQASGLLAPALEQWRANRDSRLDADPAVARLTQETQTLLSGCEDAMQAAMSDIRARQSQVRQHQRRVTQLRAGSRRPASTGCRLDAQQ